MPWWNQLHKICRALGWILCCSCCTCYREKEFVYEIQRYLTFYSRRGCFTCSQILRNFYIVYVWAFISYISSILCIIGGTYFNIVDDLLPTISWWYYVAIGATFPMVIFVMVFPVQNLFSDNMDEDGPTVTKTRFGLCIILIYMIVWNFVTFRSMMISFSHRNGNIPTNFEQLLLMNGTVTPPPPPPLACFYVIHPGCRADTISPLFGFISSLLATNTVICILLSNWLQNSQTERGTSLTEDYEQEYLVLKDIEEEETEQYERLKRIAEEERMLASSDTDEEEGTNNPTPVLEGVSIEGVSGKGEIPK